MDREGIRTIKSLLLSTPQMAEGVGLAHGGVGAGGAVSATTGSQPLDRVNGRRFSRPFHVFQARQDQTKRDQCRLMVVGFAREGVFVWFCPN